MISSTNTNRYSFVNKMILASVLFLVAIPTTLSAREWTINNKKVEAHVQDFDGRIVSLVLKNGKTKKVSVQSLNREDVAYLKTLVELQSAITSRDQSSRRTAIQLKQLQVQLEQYRSQWYELWVVDFVGPDGQRFWWAYPVRNSYQAMTSASRQFPNSRILSVRKLRRQWQ